MQTVYRIDLSVEPYDIEPVEAKQIFGRSVLLKGDNKKTRMESRSTRIFTSKAEAEDFVADYYRSQVEKAEQALHAARADLSRIESGGMTIEPTIVCGSRAEWLLERSKRIQATDVAAILGQGYTDQSALSVYQEKIAPNLSEDRDDEHLSAGLIFEPAICELFRLHTGLPVFRNQPFAIHGHPKVDYLGVSLDAQVISPEYGPCPLEAKQVTWGAEEWRDGAIPLKFEIQCQMQMECTDSNAAALVGLIGGYDLQVRWIKRNDRFLSAVRKTLEEFWCCVLEGREPREFVDGSRSAKRAIERLWPVDNGTAVALPDESEQWTERRDEIKEQMKALGEELGSIENCLRFLIGPHTYGVTPSGKILTNKHQHRASYTVEPADFRVLRSTKSLPKGIEAQPWTWEKAIEGVTKTNSLKIEG